MTKGALKTLNKNVTITESVHLKVDDHGDVLNHNPGSVNGHAHFNRDISEYYTPQHYQTGLTSDSTEQEDHDNRGVGLDFAILDSTFLLSQVFPTLFMGMIVQFTKSVTAYIACSAIFGAIAIFLANHVIFDQKDLKS